MGVGKDLYAGSAGFGRIMSIIRAIIGTLIGAGLIIGGVALIRSVRKRTASTNGRITNDDKDPISCTYDNQIYNCENIKVEWTANGKTYNNTSAPFEWSGNHSLVKATNITVYYDPSNPSDASLDQFPAHVVGWVLLALGILIIISGWVWVLITRRSKGAAAATGVASAAGMIADAVRR